MSHIDDDELTRRLRVDIDRMVGDAGSSTPPPLGATPSERRHGRGIRWLPIVAAAAVVGLVVGGLIVIAERDSAEAPVASPVESTPPTGPGTTVPGTDPTVPPEDQVYEAIGSVIDDGSGARLCHDVMESLPPQCGFGLPLVGWNWDAIDVEQSQSGVTWVDSIHVTGTYDAATTEFTVAAVRLPTDADRERLMFGPLPDFSVPCPEPEGGWQGGRGEWPGDQVAAIEGYAGAWIDESQRVFTVKFTGDLAAAEAAVRQLYDGPLCVTAASHTFAELTAIQDQLMGMSSIQFLSGGVYVDATGEWVEARTIVPDPARRAAFDEEFGQGVVRMTAWLRPVEGDAPADPSPTTAPPTPASPVVVVEGVATVIESAEHGPQLCIEGVLESYPPQCAGGPLLDGWSWDAVDDEQTEGDVTWGSAYVSGVYDSETGILGVEVQRAPEDADAERFAAAFPQADYSTPCEPPDGGWPASDEGWPGEQVAAIDGFAGAWAEAGSPMTVKFTGDLEAAEAAIADVYSGPVCVMPASRDLDELTAIRDAVAELAEFRTVDVIVDATGEWVDAVSTAPQPELQAELDAQFGAGVVRLRSLLLPVE